MESLSSGSSWIGHADQQFSGLELAVGKDVAESIVKGCQVYMLNHVYYFGVDIHIRIIVIAWAGHFTSESKSM